MKNVLIITPVKNSFVTAQRTITSVMNSKIDANWRYVVYDDFSDADCAESLDEMAQNLGFELIHLSSIVNTPSPNYRFVLMHAQKEALAAEADLVIIESDVVVKPDTISSLVCHAADSAVGMVAAVTVDNNNVVNFPYLYASDFKGIVNTKKRLSFCCTLLANRFLHDFDFNLLNPEKQWFDVPITRKSRKIGYQNRLLMDVRVLHTPHASRPWKLLKYTNPIKYYWYKLTRGMDKI